MRASPTPAVLVMCLLSSTMHLMQCGPRELAALTMRLDHAGILALLWGSDLPTVVYGFACYPALQGLYLVMSTLLIGAAAFMILSEKYQRSEYRNVRLGVMVAVCLYGWAHMAHQVALLGGPGADDGVLVLRMWGSAFGCYLVGLVFFLSFVPERFAPGTFDLVVRCVCAACAMVRSVCCWLLGKCTRSHTCLRAAGALHARLCDMCYCTRPPRTGREPSVVAHLRPRRGNGAVQQCVAVPVPVGAPLPDAWRRVAMQSGTR